MALLLRISGYRSVLQHCAEIFDQDIYLSCQRLAASSKNPRRQSTFAATQITFALGSLYPQPSPSH